MGLASDSSENETTAFQAVGRSAAAGAMWSISFSGIGKVVSLLGHVCIAWFLVPDDMGLVAITMSIAVIVAVVSRAGLSDLLVQKHNRFEELSGSAFWLALVLALAAMACVAALAPLAGKAFGEPDVVPLVLLVSAIFPLGALSTVYGAKILADLRFRTMAWIQLAMGLVQTGSAVVLAVCGFGAYSLVLPMLWVRVVAAVLMRLATGRIKIGAPSLAGWRELMEPGMWLVLFGLFVALRTQGMNLVLGALRDSHITGLFFWGFNLSSQFLFLLAIKLREVLFPSLTKLNSQPDRQFLALQRAWRTLTLIAVPVCVLQAGLADSLIPLIFREEWAGAIPVVQWLSIGMLTLPVHVVSTSIITARGRFRTLAALAALQAAVMLAATAGGALVGDLGAIAASAGVAMFVMNLLSGYVAVRCFDKSIVELIRCVGGFYVIAAIAGAACWATHVLLADRSSGAVIIVGALATLAVCAGLIRAFAWPVVTDAMGMVFTRRRTAEG